MAIKRFPQPPQSLINLGPDVALWLQLFEEVYNAELGIEVDRVNFGSDAITHNETSGLDGGTTDEYYHLTEAQHIVAIDPLLSDLTIDVDKDWQDKDIENIDNIEATTGEIGELTLTGAVPLLATDTVWEDLRVPVSAVRIGPSFPPDWENITDSLYVLAFDPGANDEQVYFTAQIPHNYKIGGKIEAHVHWGPSDTGAGDVIWCLEYSIANIGDVFPASATIDVTIATTETANDHIYTDIGDIDVSSITEVTDISTMLICRLYRESSSGSDTYASDAYLYEIDFHYEIDSLGSQDETSK